MFYSRSNHRKIDRLLERDLRIIYNDKQSSFKELIDGLGKFQKDIKKLKAKNCHCRICKKFMVNARFI